MSKHEENLWQGIDRGARGSLNTRDYRTASFTQELSQRGVEAGELAAADRSQREIKDAWIPGVEISPEKFTRSGTADFLANLYGATKGFSRGLASGPGNGQLRGCLRELPRVFTCIPPVFQKIAIQ